jgi:multicomponent Na+:H+ antiporter subunit D
LLAGSLAVGVVPAVARAVSRASVEFVDRAGYVAQALSGAPGHPAAPPPEAGWTGAGVLLGLLSALLAVGVAAAGLWGSRLPAALRGATRALDPALTALRRVHSGHVGDYVAWLFVGVTALTALVGVPLL